MPAATAQRRLCDSAPSAVKQKAPAVAAAKGAYESMFDQRIRYRPVPSVSPPASQARPARRDARQATRAAMTGTSAPSSDIGTAPQTHNAGCAAGTAPLGPPSQTKGAASRAGKGIQ